MKYPYFRGLEADRYSFYRVPKALIKKNSKVHSYFLRCKTGSI